jgi:hypothetical protein
MVYMWTILRLSTHVQQILSQMIQGKTSLCSMSFHCEFIPLMCFPCTMVCRMCLKQTNLIVGFTTVWSKVHRGSILMKECPNYVVTCCRAFKQFLLHQTCSLDNYYYCSWLADGIWEADKFLLSKNVMQMLWIWLSLFAQVKISAKVISTTSLSHHTI